MNSKSFKLTLGVLISLSKANTGSIINGWSYIEFNRDKGLSIFDKI